MRWQDQGIIVKSHPMGEKNLILWILTLEHGLHKGVIRVTQHNKSFLQPGVLVASHWSARLAEHMGHWTLEPILNPLGFCFQDHAVLDALNAACSLVTKSLAENDSAPEIFTALKVMIESNDVLGFLESYCWFEKVLIDASSFPLDFTQCAVLQTDQDLVYVSPKSGKAVSKTAGQPYHDKLLNLPNLFKETVARPISFQEILDALALTGYFLERYVLGPHDMKTPSARKNLIDHLNSKQKSDDTRYHTSQHH